MQVKANPTTRERSPHGSPANAHGTFADPSDGLELLTSGLLILRRLESSLIALLAQRHILDKWRSCKKAYAQRSVIFSPMGFHQKSILLCPTPNTYGNTTTSPNLSPSFKADEELVFFQGAISLTLPYLLRYDTGNYSSD